MSGGTFWSVLAAGLALLASLFFCVSTARLSNDTMYVLAGTYWDANRRLFDALAQQRAEYLCGTVLLPLAFLIQVVVLMFPSLNEQAMFSEFTTGLVAAGAICLVLTAAALVLRSQLVSRSKQYWEARFSKEKAAEATAPA